MAAWKYIKGSEKDFLGAPEWATMRTFTGGCGFFTESHKKGGRVWDIARKNEFTIETGEVDESDITIIAQRERVTSINDDRLAQEMRPRSIVKPDGSIDFGCIQTPLVVDNVNHPKHYTQGGIECIDAIKAATVGKSGIEAVCVANVVKYLWRYEEKNGVEDVKKARWYLERLISELGEGEIK